MADSAPAADEPTSSPSERLRDLTTLAEGHYAQKHYEQAADAYSEATALQAEINGEFEPKNADLLYAYGRCLYHLAVGKSDVLGGKVAGTDGESQRSKKRKRDAEKKRKEVDEKVFEKVVEGKEGVKSDEQKLRDAKNPFLTIEGDDADWDSDVDSDEAEGEVEGGAEEEAEEEDDFANAFEILDVARVLLKQRIAVLAAESQETSEERQIADHMRKAKELLADTHDLQSEISLENERFEDAITDATSCLELKTELYPFESSLVAEAHYKLSLALEFASVTSQKEAKEGDKNESGESSSKTASKPNDDRVDEGMRQSAAQHMESAISSTKLRVEKEQQSLDTLDDGDVKQKKIAEIKDVEEIVADMEQRLEDLKNPAVDVAGATGPAGAPDGSNPLSGIIGSMLGETPAAQKARIEEATKNATDLTGIIRHKKKVAEPNGSTKRKAETTSEDSINGKRAKTEEASEG